MPHNYETALSVVTLGGSIIGQVGFGLAADVWGRRRMYGLELIITIGANLGVVMCSNGINGSMSIMVWLLIWRFFLGIGIGAGYPLSAVICSEFAPTHLRGKMLTAVFFCQPLGQLAATLVALIAAARQRDGLSSDATVTNCTGICVETMDSIWRWVIGIGVIPAFIALWFRLTIIESPRYTTDVNQDSRKAVSELNRYLPPEEVSEAGSAAGPAAASTTAVNTSSQAPTAMNGNSVTPTAIGMHEVIPHSHLTQLHPTTTATENHVIVRHTSSDEDVSLSHNIQHDIENQLESNAELTMPPEQSWEDFKDYFWHKGNLRTLMATSLCWFCVDLPFCGLGMSSPHIITTIWYGQGSPPNQIYDFLVQNASQSLVVVSVGSIVGCLITLVSIDKLGRQTIQMNGFFCLFLLFIVIGTSFNHLYQNGQSAAIIVLYILCQIAYNFGPNTTTYIMAAELFPTRYRGLCHGISAASGKLGSVVAQLFLAYINYGHGIIYTTIQLWLPYSLLTFCFFMALGLGITYVWLPRDEYAPDGKVKTLEEWEVGRAPNRFSKTRLARIIAAVYHWLVRVWDVIYMWLDSISGGDVAQQREQDAAEAAEADIED